MKKLTLFILFFAGFVKIYANCAIGTVSSPIVDSITVNIAGDVTICWQTVTDPDLIYYTVFMVNPLTGANDSIDSIDVAVNCYTIPAANNNSDNQSIQFGIVAVDNCGNLSPVGVNYHNTMHIQNTVDICSGSIFLHWTAYDDFTSGINVLYNIYVNENGGGFSLAGTSSDTNYTYVGINQGSVYTFYIMAIENGGLGPFSSSSNDIAINTIAFLKEPSPTYVYSVSVVDSQEINLQFYVDTAADVSSYTIKRATSLGGSYASIGSVTKYQNMNPWIQYSDMGDINANSTYYFYKVEAINNCGIPTDTSNIGRTVWIKAIANTAKATNTLTITKYDGWLGNVKNYEIFRAVAGVWGSSPIASLSAFSDTTIYIDDITPVFTGNGEYCYKVIAHENPTVHIGVLPNDASSISNESCVLHDPLLYVPNAFAPFSEYNPTFKPILTFPDPSTYLFQIYNKWGQKLFETNDVNEAWNGRKNNSGALSKVDAYVYVVEFESMRGDKIAKRGVVTLVR